MRFVALAFRVAGAYQRARIRLTLWRLERAMAAARRRVGLR